VAGGDSHTPSPCVYTDATLSRMVCLQKGIVKNKMKTIPERQQRRAIEGEETLKSCPTHLSGQFQAGNLTVPIIYEEVF